LGRRQEIQKRLDDAKPPQHFGEELRRGGQTGRQFRVEEEALEAKQIGRGMGGTKAFGNARELVAIHVTQQLPDRAGGQNLA
jgi:hypothetical protein